MQITAKQYSRTVALLFLLTLLTSTTKADELSLWNDGSTKKSIVEFVKRVTTRGSKDFVPSPERIAVFDNDGTLWAEQPVAAHASASTSITPMPSASGHTIARRNLESSTRVLTKQCNAAGPWLI